MVKRGGGVVDLKIRQLALDVCVVELYIDVQESMGANVVNTICEGVSSTIASTMG